LRVTPADQLRVLGKFGVISGVNFNNGGATGAPSGTIGPTFAIAPYAGGYGEFSYHWGKKNSFIRFGATYYGKYNTYHAPAFFLLNASIHYALGSPSVRWAAAVP
jgi:hypothetical protein